MEILYNSEGEVYFSSYFIISNGNALQQQRFMISFYYIKWKCFTTARRKYIFHDIVLFYKIEMLYNRKGEVFFSFYIKWKCFTTAEGKYTFHNIILLSQMELLYNSKGKVYTFHYIILLYQIKMLYNRKGEVYHFIVSHGKFLRREKRKYTFIISNGNSLMENEEV